MKRYISTFVLVLAAAVSFHAQTATAGPELTRLLNEFLAGAGRNDAAVHDRFWADDLIYTRSTGVRTNKAEIMKGFKTPAPTPKPGDPITVYTAEDIQIHQYGNVAVVAFRLVIRTTKADGTKTTGNNLNTGTFVKRKGKWQAVAWQSTVVPKPSGETKTSSQTTRAVDPATSASFRSTENPTQQNAETAGSRVYTKGTRGGCYYLSTGGKKVYVGHDYCK